MMGKLKSEGRLPVDTKHPKLLMQARFITCDEKLVILAKTESFIVLLVKIDGKYRAMTVIIVYYSPVNSALSSILPKLRYLLADFSLFFLIF